MGRVTRTQHEWLMTVRMAEGNLDGASERWLDQVGSRHFAGEPRVEEVWLDRERSLLIVLLSAREGSAMEGMPERTRSAVGEDLIELDIRELSPLRPRYAFQGDPARPDPSLPQPRLAPWQRVDIGEDDRTLRVEYLRGIDTHLHHVDVYTDDEEVRVSVYLGVDREFLERGGGFVAAVGIPEWTRIELEEPVGDRRVRDGYDVERSR